MQDEPFESGFELVVIEGGGKDCHHHLDRKHMTIGRLDPGETPDPGCVAFPDPTVSRVHAVLDWDDKRNRYLMTHRSRTNHTVLNGTDMVEPTFVHVGDRIKMGGLVAELRLLTRKSSPVQTVGQVAAQSVSSPYCLVVLNGPDAGAIHPLNYDKILIRAPQSTPSPHPEIQVQGITDQAALVVLAEGQHHVVSQPETVRPTVIDQALPGVVRQRVPGEELGVMLGDESLVLLGDIALLRVESLQSGDMRERLRQGMLVSSMQEGLKRSPERTWDRGEQHLLRIISGPLKGQLLWLTPDDLKSGIRVGRAGTDSLVELPDRGAAQAEVAAHADGFVLRNVDAEIGLGHNWDEITPGDEVTLVSGDRFRLGRTVVRYEYLPLQTKAEALALRYQEEEMPLQRAVNLVGYSPQSDLRINDRRLAPTQGRLVVKADGVVYQHRNPAQSAQVDSQPVKSGDERPVQVGSVIQLSDGIEVTLVARSSGGSLTEPMLIGPTQAQLEAARRASG